MAAFGSKKTPSPHAPGPGGFFMRVNLLPERTRLRIVERRRASAWAFANALVALLGLIAWQWSRSVSADIQGEQAALSDHNQRVEREARIGAGLGTRMAALQKQLSTLEALRPTEYWSRRLAKLAEAVPEKLVLTRVAVLPIAAAAPATQSPAAPTGRRSRPAAAAAVAGPQPDAPRVTVSGLAADHAGLSELLRLLRDESVFEGVRLVRSDSVGTGDEAVVQFEISATR